MSSRLGIFGLSTMGKNLALNFLDHHINVSVYNRTAAVTANFIKENPRPEMVGFENLNDFIHSLEKPRIVLLLIKSEGVDAVLDELSQHLEIEDSVVDLGNSNFNASRARFDKFKNKFHFIDAGISGGEKGARFGASFLVGGDRFPERIFDLLSVVSAKAKGEPCICFIEGAGGGHFVKMIHNGIEYAVMQTLVEVIVLLKNLGYQNEQIINYLEELGRNYLQSFLLSICVDILKKDLETNILSQIVDEAGQKGTGRWSVETSMEWSVGVPGITNSVEARQLSSYFLKIRSLGSTINFHNGKVGECSLDLIEDSLRLSYLCFYDQAMRLMAEASTKLGYDINISGVLKSWRAGCILAADHLNELSQLTQDIKGDFLSHQPVMDFLAPNPDKMMVSLCSLVKLCLDSRSYCPVLCSVYNYLTGAFAKKPVGFYLIQAMRDYFGRHGVKLDGQEGLINFEWQ